MDDLGAAIEAELEAELEKTAADAGIDRSELQARELELWKQWKANPTPETFTPLYQSHMPIINSVGARYLSSTVLPKAAVRSSMLNSYLNALNDYNPDSGNKISTYIGRAMGHTGRYVTKYSNIAKIPGQRAALIDLYNNRSATLREQLGREPTVTELADDMMMSMDEVSEMERKKIGKVSPRVIGTLRRELRKDLIAESEGPGMSQAVFQDSMQRDRLVFLHGSLNPEQQLVLEHSFPEWGKEVISDPIELAKRLNMSPQKVRAIKKQIGDKVAKYG